MHCWKVSGKIRDGGDERQSKNGAMAITICHHLLLWASLYVIGSSVYIVMEAVTDKAIFASTVLLLITVGKRVQIIEPD